MSSTIKGLFGRPVRVLLAVWIMNHHGAFYVLEAQTALLRFGESPSSVSAELRVLVAHDMLTETADGRRVYFTPRSSDLWSAFAAIAEAIGFTVREDAAASMGSMEVQSGGLPENPNMIQA